MWRRFGEVYQMSMMHQEQFKGRSLGSKQISVKEEGCFGCFLFLLFCWLAGGGVISD